MQDIDFDNPCNMYAAPYTELSNLYTVLDYCVDKG